MQLEATRVVFNKHPSSFFLHVAWITALLEQMTHTCNVLIGLLLFIDNPCILLNISPLTLTSSF